MNERQNPTTQEQKWNTDPRSPLYYMNGKFYVNRNPYMEDKEAPKKGIPFDHRNRIFMMTMSDFHSTAIVLGQGEKRGLFVFEYCWGMQGFRYCSESDTPFPYDEVRYSDGRSREDDLQDKGYFAYRIGDSWGIIKVGDEKSPYSRHDVVALGEPTFESAVDKLCGVESFNPEWKWVEC